MSEINLTSDQQTAIRTLWLGLKKENKLQQTLGGYAGTGKSTIISYMISRLDRTAVCAFTGKAANVLRKKNVPASTIHSLIYEPTFYNGVVEFQLRTYLDYDQIIVDEASMVSSDLYQDLMSFGIPVIYVGDHGQLEPVGSDFNLMESPDVKLEKIHRNAGDIAKFAEWLRFNRSAKSFRGSEDKIILFDKHYIRTSGFINLACEADQVICAYNKTRCEINARMRANLGRTGLLTVGEKVMCLKNNKKHGIFNGMQGTVLSYFRKGRSHFIDFQANDQIYPSIRIHPGQFGEEKTIEVTDKDGPIPFDYAYAITCHKCVDPSTVVEVEGGLREISEISEEGQIATPVGPRSYSNLVKNPVGPNLTFVTTDGYRITVTPDHRMECWNGDSYSMKEAHSVSVGATMRLSLSATFEGCSKSMQSLPGGDPRSRTSTEQADGDLAEFLGIFVANGTILPSGFSLAGRYPESVARFQELSSSVFGIRGKSKEVDGVPAVEFNSTLLSSWLAGIKGLLPHQKDVPGCVLRGTNNLHQRFLRGLFSDSTYNARNSATLSYIDWYTDSPKLMSKVRTMLLRMGIIAGTLQSGEDNHLCLYGRNAMKFLDLIECVPKYELDKISLVEDTQKLHTIPLSTEEIKDIRVHRGNKWSFSSYRETMQSGCISRDAMASLLSEDIPQAFRKILLDRIAFHHAQVQRIDPGSGPSMCVTVPEDGRFLQNGFSHGNSQGDEFGKVIVIEQMCKNWEHRRWAYTAASRAKECLYWIAN